MQTLPLSGLHFSKPAVTHLRQGTRPCSGLLAASAFAWVLLPCLSLATAPLLKDISPTGGQRGTELTLSFAGERLQDTKEVICYEPGIEIKQLELVTNKVVKAQVRILPECALGEHHLRLRTDSGVSELRTFAVGPFAVVDEIEPNNDSAKAQNVALNTTVVGVIQNEDVDCFSVELKKGQRLSAEVEGMRLGRGAFDPRLAVLDEKGAVLADVDDTWLGHQDPFVSLVVPSDSKYVIRLREVTYGGNNTCHYRLHIGSFPRPTSVYPMGGPAGETVKLTFFSEATGEFDYSVKLPDSPQEKFGVFSELEGLLAPTPNWVRVSRFPNVLASAPNQDKEHATATTLSPPFALNGILRQPGQEDWFQFLAEKGKPLAVDVFARRLHSPLDSVIEVFDPNGHSLANNDDTSGADSAVKFTPSESTNYFVRIRDTLGQGGRDFVYRIEVVPSEPAITVKIPEVARNDTQSRQFIVVPRGNRFGTLISAKRSNFKSDLAFEIKDLPTGVTLQAERMPADIETMPLVFEASADAPLGARLLDLSAIGTNASGTISGTFRQNVELVEGPNNTTFYHASVDKLCVAVVQEVPFHLRIVEPKVPLVQGGSMRLEVVAERAPGFDEPIQAQMIWNPPGVNSQSEATIPKDATNVSYQLNAGGGAETKRWKIAVLGHATVDGGAVYVSSQLADLEVAPPFLSGKIETVWLNPGKTGKLTVNLQPAKAFDGKAKIRLCGLPDKVSAPEREITKDEKEVVFDVTAESKCNTGSYKNLFCAVDIESNGGVIPHNIASGGILRVVPPKKTDNAPASSKK